MRDWLVEAWDRVGSNPGLSPCSGILAALYDRERTGQGATLHVAMLGALGSG